MPGERQEELLRAAFSQSPPAELGELDSAPADLLPLLYRRLADAGVQRPGMARLKGVYRRTWYANQLLLASAAEAVEALRAAGIDALVVGGAAVGLLHYREVGVRSMADTRVAVRPTELHDAAGALAGTGWHDPPVAELDNDRWAARVPLTIGEQAAYAAGPGDQLVRACVHGVAWSRRPRAWRWVADALAILGPAGAEVEWTRLADRAARGRVGPHLHLGLAYLRRAFAAPIPADVVEAAGAAATPLDSARLRLSRGRVFVTRSG
jgi:hypothetical protein